MSKMMVQGWWIRNSVERTGEVQKCPDEKYRTKKQKKLYTPLCDLRTTYGQYAILEVQQDVTPLVDIPPQGPATAGPVTVIIPATTDLPRVLIPAQDMGRFLQPTAWLSDDCVNGGAQVLLRHYGTCSTHGGEPAIFSTRIFTMHCNHVDDDTIWRDCGLTTAFWRKDVWILPIHRTLPSLHWTLAIVYWRKKRIAYFDSLADEASWQTDVKAGERASSYMSVSR
ncbi:hypothetical protein BV20DRAFT_978666 [Pilatotrama ljubarskyi]|nr:hypothetical protein BV20DRAFT_978666 [Pilatotrama ljubarskyi]